MQDSNQYTRNEASILAEAKDRCKNKQQTDLGNASALIKRSFSEPHGYKPFFSQFGDVSPSHSSSAEEYSCSTGSLLQSLTQESRPGGRPSMLACMGLSPRATRFLPKEAPEGEMVPSIDTLDHPVNQLAPAGAPDSGNGIASCHSVQS